MASSSSRRRGEALLFLFACIVLICFSIRSSVTVVVVVPYNNQDAVEGSSSVHWIVADHKVDADESSTSGPFSTQKNETHNPPHSSSNHATETVKERKEDGNDEPDADVNCIFRNSSLYRKVFVYPSPGEKEWKGSILSEAGRQRSKQEPWPWTVIDNQTRVEGTVHYHARGILAQFTLELIVREILTHPDSCLRTTNPDEADLFYVPYLPSVEFHGGKRGKPPSFQTSPYAQAILNILDQQDYGEWERLFGLTSEYWKRRNGSDHILVFSEPLQGLSHPKQKRGNYHYIHTQKQLAPPIVISSELSTTFVEMYPHCTRKNILMPYPIIDGNYYNSVYQALAAEKLRNHTSTGQLNLTQTALDGELAHSQQEEGRPMAVWHSAGVHGQCTALRIALKRDYRCTPSFHAFKRILKTTYDVGMRLATYCPCPAGDSASAKRMFDAVLSGCIPVVLSHDFVWPLSTEVENESTASSSPFLLNPNDFAIRWPSANFSTPFSSKSCTPLLPPSNSNHSSFPTSGSLLQDTLERTISRDELQRLRRGLRRASEQYSFYAFRSNLSANPLRDGVLPDGGAVHALVASLAARAKGVRWPLCQAELQQRSRRPDPDTFQC